MPILKFNFEDININKFVETPLWENPNPNSAYTAHGTNITLSDDLSNYDMLCIAYKPFLDNNDDIAKTYFPMDIFLDTSRTSDYAVPAILFNHGTASSFVIFVRTLLYIGAKTV